MTARIISITFLIVSIALSGCASSSSTDSTPLSQEISTAQVTEPQKSDGELANDCYFVNLSDPENHPCPVAQLERLFAFDMKEPTIALPQVAFVKAAWSDSTDALSKFGAAELYYQCPDKKCDLFIVQTPVSMATGPIIGWGETPASAVEPVDLNAGAGEYVKGWFLSDGQGHIGEWSSEVDMQRLAWVDHNVLFEINLVNNSKEKPFGKQDLIDLANSLE